MYTLTRILYSFIIFLQTPNVWRHNQNEYSPWTDVSGTDGPLRSLEEFDVTNYAKA